MATIYKGTEAITLVTTTVDGKRAIRVNFVQEKQEIVVVYITENAHSFIQRLLDKADVVQFGESSVATFDQTLSRWREFFGTEFRKYVYNYELAKKIVASL